MPPTPSQLGPYERTADIAIVPYRPDRGRVPVPTTAQLLADHALALQQAQRREDARTEALSTEDKARRALATATEARETADRYLLEAWTREDAARITLAERLTADNAREAERRAKLLPPPGHNANP